MNLAQPRNEKVLASLTRRGPGKPEVARHDAVPNAYLNCGCHPDIVERLWDRLGASLPEDCRLLIFGTPALVHPGSGLILAVGIGTQYGLRAPALTLEAVTQAGSRISIKFSDVSTMNIRSDYGDDWVFGCWLPIELSWCKAAYDSGTSAT